MIEGLSAQGTVDGRGFLGSKSWRGQKYHIDCWCGPYSKSSRLAAVRRIAALIRRVESDPEHARSSRLRRVECGRATSREVCCAREEEASPSIGCRAWCGVLGDLAIAWDLFFAGLCFGS